MIVTQILVLSNFACKYNFQLSKKKLDNFSRMLLVSIVLIINKYYLQKKLSFAYFLIFNNNNIKRFYINIEQIHQLKFKKLDSFFFYSNKTKQDEVF